MTISKAHLIDSICTRLDLPRCHSAKLTEPLLEIIKTTLQNGEDILLSGFGKFHVKKNSTLIHKYYALFNSVIF